MKNNKKINFNRYAVSAIILLIFSLTLFFNFYNFSKSRIDNQSIFSDGNGTYLMTTFDAYYFLRLSREFAGGAYDDFDELAGRKFPKPIPLLSSLLVFIHKISGGSLEKIGFFIPPFLAGFSFLIFFLWGRLIGGNMVFAFSGILFSGSFFWHIRTSFGRFDTDAFIPIFVFILSYLVYKFVEEKERIKKITFLLAYFATSVLFIIWWLPARYLIIPCFIMPYSLSYFFYDSNKREKYLKIFFMAMAVIAGFWVFFDLPLFFPDFINKIITEVRSHISLVGKITGGSFADVGNSITELLPVSLNSISNDIAGHPIMLIFFFAGFFLMIKRHFKELIFLILPFMLGLFMFSANRFAIFFLPFYALSVAYCLHFIFNLSYMKNLSNLQRNGVIATLFIIVFAINSYKTFQFRPLPVVTQYDIKIAKSIDEKASKDAAIWAMWDYGYFLQYYAKRKTFIDGGSQNPDRAFMSSLPFAVNDMPLSSNLIKFFMAHESGGLTKLNSLTGSIEKSVSFLIKALSKKEDLQKTCEEFGIAFDKSWEEYLFPKSDVYVFLNSAYLDKSYWWYYFASYSKEKNEGIHPYTLKVNLNNAAFDVNKGLINVGSDILFVKELYNYVFKPKPGIVTSQRYANEKGLTMLVAQGDFQAYLMDNFFSQTVFVKLFFFNPMVNNEAFRAISYAPLESGAWKAQ